MPQPESYQDWLDVSQQRGADSSSLVQGSPNSAGGPYVAGYAIECALKAHLQRAGIPYPTSGSRGHDIRALWKAAGFTFRDIPDTNGNGTFFVDGWSTDLRYEVDPPAGYSPEKLVDGAKRLARWIRTQTRHRRWRR